MSCEHPQKIAYDTHEEAKAAIRSLYRNGRGNPDLNVYGCDGGRHFHIGHNRKHFQARIRRALSGAGKNKFTRRRKR